MALAITTMHLTGMQAVKREQRSNTIPMSLAAVVTSANLATLSLPAFQPGDAALVTAALLSAARGCRCCRLAAALP